MKLIRALLDRLSENFVVSVSEKLELATEPSNNPQLRLVLDKPLLSAPVDTIPRRSAGHSVSHVDALDDAVRPGFSPDRMPQRGTGLQSLRRIPR